MFYCPSHHIWDKTTSSFHEKYNPIPTRKGIETILGKALRLKHFGVWFN